MQTEKLEKTKVTRGNVKGREKEILGRSFGPNSTMAGDSDEEKFDNPAPKPEVKP